MSPAFNSNRSTTEEVLCILNETRFRESVLTQLDRIERKIDRLMAKEEDVLAALDKIDAATTSAATSLGTMAPVLSTVSDEMDVLIGAAKEAGVPQDILDRATTASSNAQTVSENLAALVPALQAIAAKGAADPVPVPVPVPAPTT